MKKKMIFALLLSLIAGSVFPGPTVTPVQGAGEPAKQHSQAARPQTTPVHEMIIFNDYQVAGVGTDGLNWVKHNEFILPPKTPLDIDIVQTTYQASPQSPNQNSMQVFLDQRELPEFARETHGDTQQLRWQVPRFTIPDSQLSPGNHLLTFVVRDGSGRSSSVNVSFRVESEVYPLIFIGNPADKVQLAAGATDHIYGKSGSRSYYASVPGTWKLSFKENGRELLTGKNQTFQTGGLVQGVYELVFTPEDVNLWQWHATLHIGFVDLYQGEDASGQKLSPGQKITAEKAPSTVKLFAEVPGRWWVNGTGQTLTESRQFEVAIPEHLAGVTLAVQFTPEAADHSASTSVQIQVPGSVHACARTDGNVDMDILMRNNDKSSLQVERVNLSPTASTIKVYQNPIHEIWLATAADYLKQQDEDSEEGPGVWVVNNVVADAAKLNWDHTALELSKYGRGRHQVMYYSKNSPGESWCATVQIIEDSRPIPSDTSCDRLESGVVPPSAQMTLKGRGKTLTNGMTVTIQSERDWEAYETLELSATHAVMKGFQRRKLVKNSKSDLRTITFPDLVWETDTTNVGERVEYNGGLIASENRVEVLYNGTETIGMIAPTRRGEDGGRDEGEEAIALRSIIEQAGSKPGTYTVKVTNKLSYQSCALENYRKGKRKVIQTKENVQTFTVNIVLP